MSYTSQYPPAFNSTYVKATTTFTINYSEWLATNPSLLLTGVGINNSWVATTNINQKFNVDLGSPQIIRRVEISNYHNSGATTDAGIKNIEIYGTNDAAAFANTTYATLTDLTLLDTLLVPQHNGINEADTQAFLISNSVAYQYMVMRCADNYGNAVMGFRRIEFQTEDGFSPGATISSYIDQIYVLEIGSINAYVAQDYSLRIGKKLDQIFALSNGASLTQIYDSAPIITSILMQLYKDAPFLKSHTDQRYRDADRLIKALVQLYGINQSRANFINSFYNITSITNLAVIEGLYSLKEGNAISTYLNGIYQIVSDGNLITPSNTLTIDGVSTPFISATCEFNQNEYPGVLEIELVDYESWNNTDYLQEVVFVNGSDTYNFLIFDKTKNEDVKNTSLFIEARSQGYILDFPYAEPVAGDFLVSMASTTANDLAALEGLTVDWQIPVDWLLTNEVIQVAGESPLAGILKIVNAVGGVLQSNPDGTLYAAPRNEVDTDKYAAAQPDVFLTTGENFETTESTADKRNGYNIYFISDVPSTSSTYTLETIRVSENEIIVKAYQDPWDNAEVELTTSDLSSVTIERLVDVNDEALCEVIEIIEGGGRTAKPIFEQVEFSYTGRDNLGNITAAASGDLTTFIPGESLVQYSYLSRYRQWRVIDFETENVQLTLRTI